MKNYKLCKYSYATNRNAPYSRRGHWNPCKKVGSVTVPLEVVYDMLALYTPSSHSGFWDQVDAAMIEAYENGDFEEFNAFEQCWNDSSEEQQPPTHRLTFTLDFNNDPMRSVILEATATIVVSGLSSSRCWCVVC